MRPPTSSRSRFLPRPTGFQENRSSRKKSCCSKLGSQSVGPDAAILHPLGNFLETVGQFFLMFYLLLGTFGANFFYLFFGLAYLLSGIFLQNFGRFFIQNIRSLWLSMLVGLRWGKASGKKKLLRRPLSLRDDWKRNLWPTPLNVPSWNFIKLELTKVRTLAGCVFHSLKFTATDSSQLHVFMMKTWYQCED